MTQVMRKVAEAAGGLGLSVGTSAKVRTTPLQIAVNFQPIDERCYPIEECQIGLIQSAMEQRTIECALNAHLGVIALRSNRAVFEQKNAVHPIQRLHAVRDDNKRPLRPEIPDRA
jgi:hypothetical protein